MENDIKNTILKSISNVFDSSKDSKLSPTLMKKLHPDLKRIAEYLHATESQAFIVSLVCNLNYKGAPADIGDMGSHLNCNPIQLLQFSDDFNELVSKSVISRKRSSDSKQPALADDLFIMNKTITEAILLNQPLPVLKKISFSCHSELLEELFNLSKLREDDEIYATELFNNMQQIFEENKHLAYVQKLNFLNLKMEDAYFFSYLTWKTLTGYNDISVSALAEIMYDIPARRVSFVQDIINNNNNLIKTGLIETDISLFFNEVEANLSSSAKKILREIGLMTCLKQKNENIINPSQIISKKLIFNSDELSQISMLTQYLKENRFKQIRSRLIEKKLPTGLTVLLYGHPGTGKTETVYQLAKQTGREIIAVDMSKTRSKWFGESEKLVKRIFNEYRDYSREYKKKPILLFNEADAIISKRRDVASSNLAQVENTIQNILLDELEKFDGIFIATTNMVINMDAAFERRFLFKIRYHLPNNEVRAKIWKTKMNALKANECEYLAENFFFSGGQIENIIRKYEVQNILNGNKTNLEQIIAFCRNENIEKQNVSEIGFRRHKPD